MGCIYPQNTGHRNVIHQRQARVIYPNASQLQPGQVYVVGNANYPNYQNQVIYANNANYLPPVNYHNNMVQYEEEKIPNFAPRYQNYQVDYNNGYQPANDMYQMQGVPQVQAQPQDHFYGISEDFNSEMTVEQKISDLKEQLNALQISYTEGSNILNVKRDDVFKNPDKFL